MIEQIDSFSLVSHGGSYESWPSKTKLLFDGVDTGKEVAGYIVELQFKVDENYLIITSYDCPFEESNSFILLDNSFKTLCVTELGQMYDSFLLEDYKIISDEEIILKYHGNYFIKLKIQAAKQGLFSKKLSYKRCAGF